MNKIRSLLQRTFGLLKEHAGTDQLGNKYYIIPEQKTWTGQTVRKRRTVEMVLSDVHSYEPEAIPSEWDAWIRGRRKDPPTIEELIQNEKYRNQVKAKSEEVSSKDKLIQERDYKEGLVSESTQTRIKGHASAAYYGKSETSQEPTSTANAFEPGSWTPPGSSSPKK